MKNPAEKPIADTAETIIRKRRLALETSAGYRSLLLRVVLLAAAGYLFFGQVFLVTQASGMDMFPALRDGDLMIVFRLHQEYEENDVVVINIDGERKIGRIVAGQTDVVMLDGTGTLTVNGTVQSGEILYPSYAKDGIEYPYRVPEGCVFVMGDHRTQAEDSRDWGAVPMEQVEGKVITILRRRGL